MKNLKISKYLGILLFITMLTLIVIASTYAKYTSSFTGTGTATAADWNVSVDGENAETHTFTLTATNKVYPGAENVLLGTIVIHNNSTLVNANATLATVLDSSAPENLTVTLDSTAATIPAGESKSVPVYASWAYTQDAETDFAGDDISFTLNLTVDQIAE